MKGSVKWTVVIALTLGVCLYGYFAYINIPNVEFYSDITHAAPIMAQVFGVAGLAWMVVYSILSDKSSNIKLIGSGLVLALAFAANNVWTYGLSIFIVATLVTELQFLEKLAALFTNRDKYWDYLAQHSTPRQSEDKARIEAIEDVAAEEAAKIVQEPIDPQTEPNAPDAVQPFSMEAAVNSQELGSGESNSTATSDDNGNTDAAPKVVRDLNSVESRAKAILIFQRKALKALKEYTSHLESSELCPQMIFTARGVNFQVDAILKTRYIDYVVEVKKVVTSHGLANGLRVLKELVIKYSNLIASAGIRKEVKGILIVPKGVWVARGTAIDTVVLELDDRTNKLKCVNGPWI